jgi:hypothetical protein
MHEFGPQCTVYYTDVHPAHDQDILKHVMQLTKQREPVNIALGRGYNQQKMELNFGWQTGYYGEYYKKYNFLAPNIALYCPTLINVSLRFPDTTNKHKLNSMPADNMLKKIHIINVIAYAFDNSLQPDMRKFMDNSNKPIQDMVPELKRRFLNIFNKMLKCAQDKGLNTIVMALFGAGAFSGFYPNLLEHIWIPMFKKVEEDWISKGITIYFMGGPNDNENINAIGYNNLGSIPQVVNNHLLVNNLDKTLFVNAWDPWSIVGNGNAADASLDGFFGRTSMLAWLTWPLTNKYLQREDRYIKVDDAVIQPGLFY